MGRDRLYLLGRMDSEITSGEIRGAEFRTTLRGFDRDEVMSYLTSIAERLERLEAENEKLASQSTEMADRDLEDEFEKIGREVSSILQSAREAADSMRERASVDAARWRSEAMEEAETSRREAAADAEALRRDAWTTGTELLTQTAAETKRMREQAERDVLTIQGEAEREAHRLTSGARREAEDLVRNARMDAEKITSDAAKRRDEIIDQANRQAAAAQERTRALEQRRDELMEELENVRSTLSRLEGSLEERRETLELSKEESTSVRVIPPTPQTQEPEHWEPGETVRVVRADDEDPEHIVDIDLPDQDIEPRPAIEPIDVQQPAVEVIEPSATRRPPAEEKEAPLEVEDVEDILEEPKPGPVDEPEANDVDALFEALREGGHVPESPSGSETEEPRERRGVEKEVKAPDDWPTEDTARDWIEVRDTRLLPITNRALRGTKKALTELQNIALDGLRTEEDWRPDVDTIDEAVQAELKAVWAESFSAGHVVAEEMTGSKIKRPPTPSADTLPQFAEALAHSVSSALDDAEDGQRARQAAASRVFRVWRTDEAERRIRELAIHSYEMGVERSVEIDTPVG
jgi:DivIVA domain-containing protein